MSKNRASHICCLVLVVIVVLSIGFIYFVYKPQQMEIQFKKVVLEDEKAKIIGIENFINEHRDMKAYIEKINEKEIVVDEKLPEKENLSKFLSEAQTSAVQNKLNIKGIKPESIRQQPGFIEIPISISLRGTYFQLIDFLQSIENAKRFVRVKNVEVHAEEDMLELKCLLIIYCMVISAKEE
jgi:type IV pilus assembly protein PilO